MEVTKQSTTIWLIIMLLVLLLPSPVAAQSVLTDPMLKKPAEIPDSRQTTTPAPRLRYEALAIHPYISLKETYNDNIFAVSQDTKGDWITTIKPGIKLVLPFRRHQFLAEYNAVIEAYSKYGSEDTTGHNARVLADLKLGSLFGLTLGDTFTRGHEPRVSTTSGRIEQFDRNVAVASASYQLADRSKVQLDYTRTRWDFMASKYRSRDEDMIAAFFFYRFLPRTSVFVEYDWRNFGYDQKNNNLDSQAHSGFVGLTWEAGVGTRSTLKAGYLNKQYKTGLRNSFDTWGVSADINHAFSDTSAIKLVAMRDVNESSALGARYFVTTGALAEYTHRFTYRISAFARASYGADEYSDAVGVDTVARNDKTFLGGVGLKYQMRDWLEFVLEYAHRDRDSNIPAYKLKQNTYSFTVNFAL